VGIVSEGDLLRLEVASRQRPWWLEALFAGQSVAGKARGRTAGAALTRSVLIVGEDMPLHEIAAQLERHHIKRVPVLRDGRLAGIVSRANLLHGLANTIVEQHEPGAAKDRRLRDAAVKALLDDRKLDDVRVNVTVSDGTIRLWGVVENAAAAAAAERAVKSLPGVKSVENNLGPGPLSGVPV
jgi:CBS-domain-containing membrane protein